MTRSKIEWTDETWNPVTGCTKVSQGCKNCYAERLAPKVFAGQTVRRVPVPGDGDPYDTPRKFTDVICHPERLAHPLRWKKPRRVFVNSMSDIFHEDVPDDFIDRVFLMMSLTQAHTYQILTKRPERMKQYCGSPETVKRVLRLAVEFSDIKGVELRVVHDKDDPLDGIKIPNVWLGVSCENQETANERIMLLTATPAAVRFVSAEPLLGPIDFRRIDAKSLYPDTRGICINSLIGGRKTKSPWHLDWVIVGGESGPKARPLHPDWARSIRDQCVEAGVPFFFKQWGEWAPIGYVNEATGEPLLCITPDKRKEVVLGSKDGDRLCNMRRFGKRKAGRELDGRTWGEWPDA